MEIVNESYAFFETAKDKMNCADYSSALTELSKIPKKMITPCINHMKIICFFMLQQFEDIIELYYVNKEEVTKLFLSNGDLLKMVACAFYEVGMKSKAKDLCSEIIPEDELVSESFEVTFEGTKKEKIELKNELVNEISFEPVKIVLLEDKLKEDPMKVDDNYKEYKSYFNENKVETLTRVKTQQEKSNKKEEVESDNLTERGKKRKKKTEVIKEVNEEQYPIEYNEEAKEIKLSVTESIVSKESNEKKEEAKLNDIQQQMEKDKLKESTKQVITEEVKGENVPINEEEKKEHIHNEEKESQIQKEEKKPEEEDGKKDEDKKEEEKEEEHNKKEEEKKEEEKKDENNTNTEEEKKEDKNNKKEVKKEEPNDKEEKKDDNNKEEIKKEEQNIINNEEDKKDEQNIIEEKKEENNIDENRDNEQNNKEEEKKPEEIKKEEEKKEEEHKEIEPTTKVEENNNHEEVKKEEELNIKIEEKEEDNNNKDQPKEEANKPEINNIEITNTNGSLPQEENKTEVPINNPVEIDNKENNPIPDSQEIKKKEEKSKDPIEPIKNEQIIEPIENKEKPKPIMLPKPEHNSITKHPVEQSHPFGTSPRNKEHHKEKEEKVPKFEPINYHLENIVKLNPKRANTKKEIVISIPDKTEPPIKPETDRLTSLKKLKEKAKK